MRTIITAALVLAACEPVLESDGPNSLAPQVAGVMKGTVLYIGPRPACVYDHAGAPEHLVGRAVLTLFAFNNPPPPAGKATSALNLLIIPAVDLFVGLEDCMPEAPSAADREFITRSAPFAWPEMPLGADYQVRGFFDYDEDFNPFFAVRNQPTRGDVAGGAFVSATAAVRQMARVHFGTVAEHPLGQVVSGVVVTLAAPVNTERPMFRLGATTRPLSAEATVPAVADPIQLLSEMWALSQMDLTVIDEEDAEFAAALAAAGVELDFDCLCYAWYVEPVDANGDGEPDAHPVLGASGIMWETPIVLLKRARSGAEVQAGVPDVVIVASVDPLQTAVAKVVHPTVRITVPPIAAVDLKPDDPSCRIPYVPPNNLPPYYAGVTECQELPTGRYDVNVLHGVAAGLEERDTADPTLSQTGHTIHGGSYSGQPWSIPNELGPSAPGFEQLPADVLLASQGTSARFAVVEPDPSNGVRTGCAAPTTPVPAVCCAAVEHLCDVPLCEPHVDADGHVIRSDEGGELTCLAFAMPTSCCP